MAIADIMKYLRQTPGNTNPAMVKQMINAEMNGTLQAAKDYTDSKLGSSVITKLHFNGNLTEDSVTVQLYDNTYIKISEIPTSLNNLSVKSLKIGGQGDMEDMPTEALQVKIIPNQGANILLNEIALIIIINTDVDTLESLNGVWFLLLEEGPEDQPFLLEIEAELESIKKIDSKYISLPFPQIILSDIIAEDSNSIPIEDIKKFESAIETNLPCLITFQLYDESTDFKTGLFSLDIRPGTERRVYRLTEGKWEYRFERDAKNSWVCNIISLA